MKTNSTDKYRQPWRFFSKAVFLFILILKPEKRRNQVFKRNSLLYISPKKAALYQVKSIVQARKTAGWKLTVNERGETQVVPSQKVSETDLKNLTDYSEYFVRQIIHRHTEKKLLGLFGKDRVNVLLVNLELDGVVQK